MFFCSFFVLVKKKKKSQWGLSAGRVVSKGGCCTTTSQTSDLLLDHVLHQVGWTARGCLDNSYTPVSHHRTLLRLILPQISCHRPTPGVAFRQGEYPHDFLSNPSAAQAANDLPQVDLIRHLAEYFTPGKCD